MEKINLLTPWEEEYISGLEVELARELIPGHVLYGVPVKVVARRRDNDDALFKLEDGSGRYAMVHLTWNYETNPIWPMTDIYSDLDAWMVAMKADHDDYTSYE